MANSYREADHPRDPHSKEWVNKNKSVSDDDLEADDSRYARMDRWMARELEHDYPTRARALAEAIDLEGYTGGLLIARRGDGWGLAAEPDLGQYAPDTCDIEYDDQGRFDPDSIDFGMDAPDDHRIVAAGRVNTVEDWASMPAVKDFLEGRSDGVTVSTVRASGFTRDGDLMEDSGLDVLCANRSAGHDWQRALSEATYGDAGMRRVSDDLTEGLSNAMNTLSPVDRGSLEVWPGDEGDRVYVARRDRPDGRVELGVTRDADGQPSAWAAPQWRDDGGWHDGYPDTEQVTPYIGTMAVNAVGRALRGR